MQRLPPTPTAAARRDGAAPEDETRIAAAPATALSVVVPVYNGEEVIIERVRALRAHLAGEDLPSELIVVDDGSNDDTATRLAQVADAEQPTVPLVRLRHPRNRGKGAAIVTGMHAARGAMRVFVDADHAYPPSEIRCVVDALQDGADVAVACRVHAASRLILRPGNLPYVSLRFAVGRMLHWLVRPLLRLDLRDTQAGLKGFRAPVADRLFDGWLPRGFSFDLALLFRARRLGMRIVEVPVVHTSLSEPTTVRLVRDTAAMVRDVVQIRLGLIEDHFEAWDSALRTRQRSVLSRLQQLVLARPIPPVLFAIGTFALFLLLRARHAWESIPAALAAWLTMLAVVLLSAWRSNARAPVKRTPWFNRAGERRLFLIIFLLGAALRFIRLDDLPPMMHGDSAWCGNLGLMLLRGEVRDVFDFSGWYFVPYLSFLPYAASFLINGVSVVGLRFPSALLGTLVIPPLYFLTRGWFGRRPAVLATFLYAVGHSSIHFSRIGLWNVQVAFYGVSAFALVTSGIRRGCMARMASAGVLSGLALYSYTGGRLITLVILIVLAAEWVRRRRLPRGTGYYLAGLVLAIVPLLDNYARDPGILGADRAAAVWALSAEARPHVEASLGVSGPVAILREQVSRTVGAFVTLGDASTQYETSQPILSWLSAVLAAIGVLAMLRCWREQRFFFLLLWLGLGLLLGSVLIIDPLSYTRVVLVFPAVYILVAVGMESLIRRVAAYVPVGRVEVGLACCLVAGQAALFNLTGYYRFTQQVALMPREWDVLKVVERLGAQHDLYLFTGPLLLADSSIFQLFSPDTRTVSGFTAADIPATLSHDTAFILTPEFRGAGRVITERFPGVERDVIDVHGVRQLAVYRCTADNACRGAS